MNKKTKNKATFNKNKYLLFSAPSLIIICAIMIFPVCYAIYLSFFNYKLGGTPDFVGLKNYVRIFTDPEFLEALRFTVLYTVITVAFQVVLGMFIALLMDNITKGRKIISIFTYLPYFISASVCGIIFRWMFISNWGIIAQIFNSMNITAPSWFESPILSQVIVMMAEVWQSTPFVTIILYAGLQSVSMDQLEAASIDGANAWNRFWSIKIPHLRQMFALIFVMRAIDAFRVYDRLAVMTQGGPGTATESISLYTYKMAFTNLRLGRGSAAGVIILLITMIPVFFILRVMRSDEVD